jgi:hypothetical protein
MCGYPQGTYAMNFSQIVGDRRLKMSKGYKPVYISPDHYDRIIAKAKVEVCTNAQVGECLIRQFLEEV